MNMKKITTHIYIVAIFFAVAFVIGSFFDYQINSALFHNNDTFGLVMSSIGTIPGYGILSFMGGGLLFFGLKKEFPHVAWKIISFVLAAVLFGSAIFFSGREFFGINGFYNAINPMFGYLIILPVEVGIAILGYVIAKKSDNNKLWIVYFVIAVAFLIALVAGVTLFKSIFHRPRFRAIMTSGISGLDYHAWYSPCTNYKDFIAAGVNKDNFKSFPSGHAGTASAFMMFMIYLPYINSGYKKYQIPLFYGGFIWLVLIAFSRMYVGAHFLSDVSMGVLLPIACFYIGKVVIDKTDYFTKKKERVEEPKE